jgi:gluconokinase
MSDAGVGIAAVRATGGAIESPLWRSILAANLGLQADVAASPEGIGTGAGLLGHHALGALKDLDEAAAMIPVDRGTEPDTVTVQIYSRLRPLVERCTHDLTGTFAALNDIRESTAQP